IERRDFAGVRCVHRIEQRRKCVTEAEAAATAVTDVEDPLELPIERAGVVEGFASPVEWVPGRGLEASFASAPAGGWTRGAHMGLNRSPACRVRSRSASGVFGTGRSARGVDRRGRVPA